MINPSEMLVFQKMFCISYMDYSFSFFRTIKVRVRVGVWVNVILTAISKLVYILD